MSYPPSTKPAALAIFFFERDANYFFHFHSTNYKLSDFIQRLGLPKDNRHDQHVQKTCFCMISLCLGHVIICICNNQGVMRLCSSRKSMQNLKSKICNETKFIQFLKQVRWHFCQALFSIIVKTRSFLWSLKSKERERNGLNTYTITCKTSNKHAILLVLPQSV